MPSRVTVLSLLVEELRQGNIEVVDLTQSLGPDTPVETLAELVGALRPRIVVVSASLPERLEPALPGLRRLAANTRLIVAGPGATPEYAERARAELVAEDPVSAADRISRR